MRPGTNVSTSTALPPIGPATKTGTWFAAGPTATGPTSAPVLITSFAQFQKIYGTRFSTTSFSATFYDAIETFFLEGGARVYVLRVSGAGVVASIKLKNAAEEALEVKAVGPGTSYNNWKIVIGGTAETAWTIQVQNASGEVMESSPAFVSRAEAVTFFKNSPFINCVALGGTKPPSLGTFTLAGGTDVAVTVSKAEVETWLEKFSPELGPGQLSVPGITGTAATEALFIVASRQKRVALVDGANGETKANLITLGGVIRGLPNSVARAGAIYADWQQVAPLSGTVSARAVPCSAFVAAKLSVNDDATGNPNQPCAGKWGILNQSLGRETPLWTEAEVEELALAGINITKLVLGKVRIYGFRTAVNASTEPLYFQFNNARLDMAIVWKGNAILEEYFGSEIDGQGIDAGNLNGDLSAMLLKLYTLGAIFGGTPQEAFAVSTGEAVNPLSSEAEGNLNAQVAVRRAPGAEQVNLNVTRVSITQGV